MENISPSSSTKERPDVLFNDSASTNVAGGSGSRIHFSTSLDAPAIRTSRQYPEYLSKTYGMGFAPPVRRGSPLNPTKAHRRNASPLDSPTLRHRRVPSPGTTEVGSASPMNEADISLLSNEYDLSQEDPRILQDVQRAIQLKARREARLKRQQQSPSLPSIGSPASVLSSAPSLTSSPSSQSPWAPRSVSTRSPPESPSPPRKASNSTASVDFSPQTSTANPLKNPTYYAHPVPTSLDNGRTLDWTASGVDDDRDRKWMSIGKKKGKDSLRILPLGEIAEQQEQMYKERLAKIKQLASQQTSRKATITKQQLERRYNLLQAAQETPPPRGFDLAKVARWYSTVDEPSKRAIEKSEPFSWLRHLEGTGQKRERSPWHLTGLIMQEYGMAREALRDRGRKSVSSKTNFSMETIPDETTLAMSSIKEEPEPLSPGSETLNFGRHHPAQYDSLESKIRGTYDSTSSFRFPNPQAHVEARTPQQPYLHGHRSDASSAAGSNSDFSDAAGLTRLNFRSLMDHSPLLHRPEGEEDYIPIVIESPDRTAPPIEVKLSISSGKSVDSKSPHGVTAQASAAKKNLPRRIWNPSSTSVAGHGVIDDEIRLRREYEVKLRILEESNKQNHRVRQMLNRISAAAREYEAIQNSSSKKPGVAYHPLPKELLDAFRHDPAAVTGSTRRVRGWRAVEDIHQRVVRQREVFRNFLDNPPEPTMTAESILSGPAESLVESLDTLEHHRNDITLMAANIALSLQNVQELHGRVQEEYNYTLSKTSVLYPELSHIIALEESYRDRYQGFYDFGMDALTLFLDTVTPLWRTYGKTIGEDVRDFLIIPLYRNEFTGEGKRYPIVGLPPRSTRHWLGLIVFFHASIGVNILQLRTAVTSISHYNLYWIPYEGVRWTALPVFWLAIVIQWIAVTVEFAIVLMQLGTIAWWLGWFVKIFN